MCKAGFYRSISDAAGFRQVLCTSAMHQAKLRGNKDSSDALALSNLAIQSVNSRLADPLLATTDGVIGAVLAFALHAVSTPASCGNNVGLSNGWVEYVQ